MSSTDPDIETRMTVFHRDHGRCFICGRQLSAYAFNVHHRRMRSHKWPGLNLPSNLLTVCGSGTMGCHARIHQHPKASYENGWLVSAYEDEPATVSVRSEYRNADYVLDDLGGCYTL